jgi:tetratricopeptide (TPR) repeat protein
MKKKNLTVWLVLINLSLVFCVVILLVLTLSREPRPPLTSDNKASVVAQDANSESQKAGTSPDSKEIIAYFGIMKEERRQKAIEDYEQIIRSEPPYLGTLTEVYRYAQNNQWDKAQAICNHYIQYGEDKREALYGLAWIYAKQGNYKDAVKLLDELVKSDSSFIKSYVVLGWINVKEGRYDEAISACKNIITIAPDNEAGHYGLGRLYAFMDKPAEAIASYSEAIRIKPDFAEAHLFLGLVYCKQGQWADALKPISDAVSYKREYEQAYLFRALAYDELGLYKEASEDIVHAQNLSHLRPDPKDGWSVFGIEPDYARYNCSLAEIYAKLGEYHKAVLACNDAISINPAYPEAYYNMALAYLLLGEKDSALQQREKLISLKANDLLAKLDELLNK